MGFSSLAIGTSALLTARYGIDVTGQNLGNVDTPGYSRQRLNQIATIGRSSGLANAASGNGVWVASIKRVGNEYVEKQLRQATSQDEYYGTLNNAYSNMQSYFNELTGNALSDSISNFWGAMNDLSGKVENIPIRSTTLEEAKQMCARFNALSRQLAVYRRDVDAEVAESVTQINRIMNSIADYNKNIVAGEYGGINNTTANDLRDQRGELLKELYEYMDVDTVEEPNGSIIVSMHGRNLVYFDQVQELRNEKTLSSDGTMVNTPVFSSDHYPIRPTNGELAAQIETRDRIIPSYQKEVDSLSGNFIWEFNRAHSQATGLETYSDITTKNSPKNPWDTLDKMDWGDNIPEGTFQIANGNFEIVIHNRNSDQPQSVNIEVDLDGRPGPSGEPDMILWDPDNPDASHALVNRLQSALEAAAPGVFEVSIDRDYQLSISSKSSDYGFTFGNDTSGVLAALGLNVFFTGHNAGNMGVNQELVDNPSLLAGAFSFEKGDNGGIASLLGVREKKLGNLKEGTLDDYYLSITGRLASEANKTTNLKTLSTDVLNRMFTQRESMAGVNEDEEVSKLIVYQRSFQSAAKFISTVDQLYETLLNM